MSKKDSNIDDVELSEKATRCLEQFSKSVLEELLPVKFNTNTLRDIHFHSYHNFITTRIDQILSSRKNIILDRGRFENRMWVVKQQFSEPRLQMKTLQDGSILTPQLAKRRASTYTASLRVQYRQIVEICRVETGDVLETRQIVNRPIVLANIPIMVRSSVCPTEVFPEKHLDKMDCPYDEGGYFIISGQMKQIIPHEMLQSNKILIFSKKLHGSFVPSAEVRSMSLNRQHINITTSIRMQKDGMMTVSIPQFRDEVPLCILLRSLGMQSDQEIAGYVCLGRKDKAMLEALSPSFIVYPRTVVQGDSKPKMSDVINTKQQSLIELSAYIRQTLRDDDKGEEAFQKRMMFLNDILRKDLLPHLKVDSSNHTSACLKKAKYLCLMANRLLQVHLERRSFDDRDSYENKRIIMAGEMLASVFMRGFDKLKRETIRHYKKRASVEARNLDNMVCPDISHNIKSNIIDKDIKQAIARGEFILNHNQPSKGISAPLETLTRLSTLCMQMRIKTMVIDKNSKATENRLYHNTQAFALCPVNTPEGANTGHHKHLTLTAELSVNDESSAERAYQILDEEKQNCGLKYLRECKIEDFSRCTGLFLNGDWVGVIKDWCTLFSSLRKARFNRLFHYRTSFYYEIKTDTFYISTMGGRICRPLFVVDETSGRLRMSQHQLQKLSRTCGTWDDVLVNSNHAIEYMDIEEIMHTTVAMTPVDVEKNRLNRIHDRPFCCYSHCELHPYAMFGKMASTIPFPEFNQAARNMFQASHGRASVGQPNTNYKVEVNMTSVQALNRMQRPLVQTHSIPWLNVSDVPSGNNIIVAFATYTGFNQEDAIIINGDSLDAGLFRMAYYRKYESQQKKNYTVQMKEKFERPNPYRVSNMRPQHFYDKLDKDGLIREGTWVESPEIIIGKTIPVEQSKNYKPFRDASIGLRPNTSGYVDKVIKTVTSNQDQKRIVRIRSTRTPQVGDKLSSRCGQKGTIGLVLPGRDMPYTKSGIKPDIIINPACMPSRMTVGLFLEMLTGIRAAEMGDFMNASGFTNMDKNRLYEELEKLGYDRYGLQKMVNGMTGQEMDCEIFCGVAYYQRLKHMVQDKVHMRSTGPMQNLTRQPSAGRQNMGGLRVGEMERDALLSHGMSDFIMERLMRVSDETKVHVCRECGCFAYKHRTQNIYICEKCRSDDFVSELTIPYAFKLFTQYLKTMNVDMKMNIAHAIQF